MKDNDFMNRILDEVINNRMEEIFMSSAKTEEDEKTIAAIRTVARRHNMSFFELLTILTELTALAQYEE